jgi:hypothetical protein
MLQRFIMAAMLATVLAGCQSGSVEERKVVGDSEHTYRYYYDKDHKLTKKETYLNGHLEKTENFATP